MTDLKAHLEVSKYFPTMPREFNLRRKGSRKHVKYLADRDGSIRLKDVICGSWWPHSASCIEVNIDGSPTFFSFRESCTWEADGGEQIMVWSQPVHQRRSSLNQREDTECRLSANMSRFRTSILPLHPLNEVHRSQLKSMGLCVCFHSEIGRVLVTARCFGEGEVVIYSKVSSFEVESDSDVLSLLNSNHPSSCYLLVPRLKLLYYNRATFNNDDPISSGDLWYLVNHSGRPNVEVLLRKSGIQFKARRAIQPNEPLVWTYPATFFAKEETPVDLPQYVIPDRMVSIRE